MSHQNIETVNRSVERAKLGAAVILLAAGIVAYSVLAQYPIYLRLGAFVLGLVLAVALVMLSETGKRTFAFGRESYNEIRRVVWPTRQETIRMTAVVFAFVVAMGLLLWIADKLLGWVIYGLLLGWN